MGIIKQNKTLREFICDLEKENYPSNKIVDIVKEKLRIKPLKNISLANDMLRELEAICYLYGDKWGNDGELQEGKDVVVYGVEDIIEKYKIDFK